MKQLYPRFSILIITTVFVVTQTNAQWNPFTDQNTPICTFTGSQKDARIEGDGNGGAFIVWKDYRTGIPDIYVQHIDSNGVIQWALDGIGACTDPYDQSTPSMTTDMAGGIIITWSDWRSQLERDIYAQRIDASGNMLWQQDGAIVTVQIEREHNERIVSDGAGGCIIAFEKQVGNWDIWAQRLNSAGATMWGPGGVPVSTVNSNKRNPKLQKDHSNGAYITWQDNRNVEYDVLVQRLSSTGFRLWGDSALQVTNVINDQTNPKIDPDGVSGGVYVAWADERNGATNDIFCQRIDSLGNVLWPANGVGVCLAANDQSAVDILSNSGINGVILTWKDGRSGNNDIYAQHLNQAGTPLWGFNGRAVCSSPFPQINPNICGDSRGGAIIAYQDSLAGSFWNVSAQRVDSLGNLLWGGGVIVANALGSQTSPKNISDRNGGSIFIFEDDKSGEKDIYAHHIGPDGTSIGIEENNISILNVYPNPFIERFKIQLGLKSFVELRVTLHNITGAEIQNIQVTHQIQGLNQEIDIDASMLEPGIYFVHLNGEDAFESIKLIKQ